MGLWILFLFLGGMLLIFSEFFVPGGILGIFGLIMIIASCVLGFAHYPDYAFWIVLGELVGAIACVVAGFYVLPRTPFGKNLFLAGAQKPEDGWVSTVTDASLIGQEGTVFTALRPAGTIVLDGKRYDAVSDATFIEKGATVRVVEVHGNRIVVEEEPSE